MHEDEPQRRDVAGGNWLASARNGLNFVIAVALGLATYIGSRFSDTIARNLPVFALGAALLWTVYMLVTSWLRERLRPNAPAGILGAWQRRWNLDRGSIVRRFERSTGIDILGYNMRNYWLSKGSEFDELLRKRLGREKHLSVRILLADPERPSLERRELIENQVGGRMKADGIDALQNLCGIMQDAPNPGLKVKLIDADYIHCSMIFIDDRCYVTSYLSVTGNNCPTLELKNVTGGLYKTYREEFERLWGRAVEYRPE